MRTSELLGNLLPVYAEDLLPGIHEALEASGKTIVVLDDDPSGTQTVFDVPVLTQLDADSIRDAIDEAPSLLFLLTNSRAQSVDETTKLHRDLGGILKEFGDDIIVISRSDSFLRGHFPLETNLLREALGIPMAPTLFIPFSEAGGCLTIDDTHYFVRGGSAIPAHLTPFAKDHHFPFSHSYLPDYIAEKAGGPVDVQSLSLAQLRSGHVSGELAALPEGCTCIVNAASKKDLDVLALALHQSERRFVIRSAPSFVQSLAGITSRPLLDSWQMQDLDPNPNGGLIIVGSHVPKTSAQLAHLLEQDVVPFELNVPSLLEGVSPSFPLDETLSSGETVVLFTSRDRIDGADNLAISKAVSGALVDLVKGVKVRPSFIIAKGGITSSDIATEALGIKKAQVLGQILPGVPVWTMGSETRHPGLAYVVFAGNAGDETALTLAFNKLNS